MSRKKTNETPRNEAANGYQPDAPEIPGTGEPGPVPVTNQPAPVPELTGQETIPDGQLPLAGIPSSTPATEMTGTQVFPERKKRKPRKPKVEAVEQPAQPPVPEPSPQAKASAAALAKMLETAWIAGTANLPEQLATPIRQASHDMTPNRELCLIVPADYALNQLGPEGQLVLSIVALVGMEVSLYAQLQTMVKSYNNAQTMAAASTPGE